MLADAEAASAEPAGEEAITGAVESSFEYLLESKKEPILARESAKRADTV